MQPGSNDGQIWIFRGVPCGSTPLYRASSSAAPLPRPRRLPETGLRPGPRVSPPEDPKQIVFRWSGAASSFHPRVPIENGRSGGSSSCHEKNVFQSSMFTRALCRSCCANGGHCFGSVANAVFGYGASKGVRTINFREKPQVPPLRCASVGMTTLLVVGTVNANRSLRDLRFFAGN